jgi:hypothetical protein
VLAAMLTQRCAASRATRSSKAKWMPNTVAAMASSTLTIVATARAVTPRAE